MVSLQIKPNTYYDSITLMIISKELKKVPGVKEALVGMGTDLNLDIAKVTGLSSPELEAITPNDFFVALDCENEEVEAAALKALEEQLNKKEESRSAAYYPPTLTSALKADPKINLALISVPGRHAYDVAKDALDKNINVMLFSDNVSMEEEKKLKEYAVSKELLMMGPDCGTAIIAGVPLALANVVRRGDIGIVAASGTGIQEVTCLIDRFGGGITHALGCGGRDLRKQVGGLEMRFGIKKLAATPGNKTLLLLSKPGDPAVLNAVLDEARATGLRTVTCLIGGKPDELNTEGIIFTRTLEEAASASPFRNSCFRRLSTIASRSSTPSASTCAASSPAARSATNPWLFSMTSLTSSPTCLSGRNSSLKLPPRARSTAASTSAKTSSPAAFRIPSSTPASAASALKRICAIPPAA